MGNILDEIVHAKRREVAEARARRPLAEVQAAARAAAAPRDFHAALSGPPAHYGIHVIAEIKRRSPSAGLIRADFDPQAIARIYQQHHATCLSVLTDGPYFDGRPEYLQQVKAAVPLPVLRKDFIVDAYQVYESRAAGADCVLLIGEVLPPAQLTELLDLAWDLGMTSLIEVHEADTLAGLRDAIGFPNGKRSLLGINNRNLKFQKTDLATTERLAGRVGAGTILVSESGVKSRADVDRLIAAGARALLIGETFMKAPDIGAKMHEVLQPA
ncbi:MAG: indole-3-glycerol phosphate synthase TrpC [Planctomycetes bacterium]|nr:indole-3-glycerol phosphate synthase TrpC [Planctomycetota bacterium]